MLHETIFAGVIRDDGENAPWCESVTEVGKCTGNAGEFVVDGNAHGLKEPREFRRPTARAERGTNGPDEIVARGEGSRLTATHDLTRQSSRARLVAEVTKDLEQLILVGFVEQGCGGVARGASAPMRMSSGRALSKGVAALRVVDLMCEEMPRSSRMPVNFRSARGAMRSRSA